MQISPDLMRQLLIVCMMLMAILAVLYLRGRRMALGKFALLGMVVILIPIIGPFIVIWMKPGD